MGGLCQVPKIMHTISYAFNITWKIVIIVKDYLNGFLSVAICLLSKMLQNLASCILLEGFTNFLVDLYYGPLSLVMIYTTLRRRIKGSCRTIYIALCTGQWQYLDIALVFEPL